MLDTNTVSDLIKGKLRDYRGHGVSLSDLCVSVITEAELLFGLARRPEASRLAQLVGHFLASIDSLAFDSVAAKQFASLRAAMDRSGKSLTPLDMLIAAHALSIDAVLVTSDKAFLHVPQMKTVSWV
jgi:tRNA(fMet)-specific endonuclease VapC